MGVQLQCLKENSPVRSESSTSENLLPMNDMIWKRTKGCDWQAVADQLADEERTLALS